MKRPIAAFAASSSLAFASAASALKDSSSLFADDASNACIHSSSSCTSQRTYTRCRDAYTCTFRHMYTWGKTCIPQSDENIRTPQQYSCNLGSACSEFIFYCPTSALPNYFVSEHDHPNGLPQLFSQCQPDLLDQIFQASFS